MSNKNTFEKVSNTFQINNCKLTCSKEEFNSFYINARSKLKYIASCGHENIIEYKTFKSKNTGNICPNCVYKNNSKKLKIKYSNENKLDRIKLEHNCILYLKNLLINFDFYKTNEGCKADIILRPKCINSNDLWMGIQIKSTLCKKLTNSYSFDLSKDYENILIICICYEDKNIWIFENNIVKNIKSGLTISKKSKYNEFLVCNNLNSVILDKYNKIEKKSQLFFNTPLSVNGLIEYKYRQIRETKIDFIKFINNDIEGLSYDFKVNEKKVQEKVGGNLHKNKNSFRFNLTKMNGRINNKKVRQTYKVGDNDIYWFNCKDTMVFYVIPENILIQKGYIGNNDGKLKSLIISNTNKKIFWIKDYLFNYDDLEKDKEKLCKILL
jgi:hypothetical protein